MSSGPISHRLAGRRALVTGAGSGIGRATALRLAAEGADTCVTDVDPGAAEAVLRELELAGGTGSSASLDVADGSDWRRVIAQLEPGPLDVLVNNAGIGEENSFDEPDVAAYRRSVRVNQDSVFLALAISAPLLRRSQNASVINMSSIFAFTGGFGGVPGYHATKAAVTLMTKNAAVLWAEEGIRVNSVHPGFIDTPMLDGAKENDAIPQFLAVTPMRRLGLPEEVAACVAFLASDDASFVTGTALVVDGGYLAR